MDELKKLFEELQKAFEAFKKANDERLAEIEKRGRADPLLDAKVDKANAEISRLEKEMRELETKANRPHNGGAAEESDETKQYRKAFAGYVRKGRETDALQKGVSVSDDTAGGYLVPTTLDTEIEKYERDNTPMRGICRVMSVSNENYEKLVQQGAAAAGWMGETVTEAETAVPTLASLKPYFGGVWAEPISSQKALDDAMINVEAWLAEEVAISFAEYENESFTSGDGIKKPKGFLAHTMSTSVDGTRTVDQIQYRNSGTDGSFSADNLIDLIHDMKRGYRIGAAWMMSNLAVAIARKLKGEDSQYLWRPGMTEGQPSTIFGYPIEENDDMPVPATDAYSVAFGNWRRAYTIYDVRGTRVIRDAITSKGNVKFFTWKRLGGRLINDRAIKLLCLST